ncbi:AraC family transcriptional regulator [Enterocloster citroniae]|uniref:helix-turn-helix domain-containing protein n=1 Tax=Enterocloster citroniae TaxID=358743 RepID=UPI001D0747C1|nr:AraC family transcriptional regulator [Enterocloster citroniae]MCB7067831.1 AraC family transcriptional regulator [Enterocloster citroniae]
MNGIFLPHVEIYEGDFRGIMRNPSCEFDAGAHFHDFYEIQFYLTDAGIIIINDQSYQLHSGDVVLINMFESHRYIPKSGSFHQRFSVSLDPSFLLSACSETSNLLTLFDKTNPIYPIYHFSSDQFNVYCNLLLSYKNNRFDFGKDVYERALHYEILANLFNDLHHDGTFIESNTDTISIISHLLRYIREHLCEELPLEKLAQEVHFSTSYLCRIFKKYTGNTLKQYIKLKKIEMAKQLLQNNMTSNNVCTKSGFNNYSYFYKTFKNIVGISPSEYQEHYCTSQKNN